MIESDSKEKFANWKAPIDFKVEAPESVAYEASEATSEQDLYGFYLLHSEEYKDSGYKKPVEEIAKIRTWVFIKRDNPDSKKIFVIKNEQGQVVAGALLVIEENEKGKVAYVGQKVVAPNSRGQNFGSELVKKRLQVASELGCKSAYCLVTENNSRALRVILRDGFLLTGYSAEADEGDKSWRLEKDLSTESSVETTGSAEAAEISDESHLNLPKIQILFENKNLLRKALNLGYVGKSIVLPENFNASDSESVHQVKVYLEKK